MSVKRPILVVVAASLALSVVGLGPPSARSAQAPPPASEPIASSAAIPYWGGLADEVGGPVPDGAYDLSFALYEAETGGEPQWSEVQEGVVVADGAFVVSLGSVNPIPADALGRDLSWLAVGVRGPEETDYTVLTPRQRLGAISPASPVGLAAAAACPHDHFGEDWVGVSQYFGLRVENDNNAIVGVSHGDDTAIMGVGGDGQYGKGVYGSAELGVGVYGTSVNGYGIEAYSQESVGTRSQGIIGVHAIGVGSTKDQPALRAQNSNSTNGMAAYLTNQSGYHTAHFQNNGNGGVLFLQNNGVADGTGGGDFITAVARASSGDTQFRVTSDGTGYADGGWQGAADFAELMTTENAVAAYEPGDVLVISTQSDRSAALSSEPYSTLVLGVYSEKPGFIGSPHAMEERRDGEIPVAVAGIVSCKASAENGAISRGDLLVTSSTPGRAMRADNPTPGTILGKALEPLKSGTGVILILVTLQ